MQLRWEGTKEKFWPVFTCQLTAIRSKQTHTVRESTAVIPQVVPSLTSLPLPVPTVRLVQVSLHLWDNGAEIPSSHSAITSEGAGDAVRDAHPALHGSTPATDRSLPASITFSIPNYTTLGTSASIAWSWPTTITVSSAASSA